jgi:hypothetical protein
MRYLFGFLCVCALGLMPLMGCSETSGEGGSGGSAGSGGTGGMPECQSPEDCDDGNECTVGTCANGACDSTPVTDGAACDESNECTTGMCADGTCDATPVADGTACGDDAGTCQQSSCQVACTEQGIRDAIVAGGGPYTFDCGDGTTIVTKAEIFIDNDVILDGGGNLTVDANKGHRVFSVPPGVTAELHGLTVTRGTVVSLSDVESGGGILNDGALTLVGCTVRDNAAEHGEDCYNPNPGSFGCVGVAGGIRNAGGTLTLQNSTVSGNTADVNGGILNDGQGRLVIMNSTVSANTTMGYPGAADTSAIGNGPLGTLTLVNSTVSEKPGGAVGNEGIATVTNSLVDGECGGGVAIVSNGYNIESPGDTCGFDQSTDQVNVSGDDRSSNRLTTMTDRQ